ncbi:hypothetical protein FQR65_LT04815 [Abscondita terminalis]|nr:hypothetical protein FQR65_LT04815 [Abscondita terminalis]
MHVLKEIVQMVIKNSFSCKIIVATLLMQLITKKSSFLELNEFTQVKKFRKCYIAKSLFYFYIFILKNT